MPGGFLGNLPTCYFNINTIAELKQFAPLPQGAGGCIYEMTWNAGGDLLAACFQGNQLLVAELCK